MEGATAHALVDQRLLAGNRERLSSKVPALHLLFMLLWTPKKGGTMHASTSQTFHLGPGCPSWQTPPAPTHLAEALTLAWPVKTRTKTRT